MNTVSRSSISRARAVSRELRTSTHPMVERRRGVVALTLVAAGAMGVTVLYQMGMIRRIPEPRTRLLNSSAITGSARAYSRWSTPDAALGLCSYALTLALAAAGGRRRAARHPWIPLTLAAKAAFDVAVASRLTAVEWKSYRAFCLPCLIATAATVAIVPLVVPEARAALR